MAWSEEGGPQGTVHMIAEGTDRPDVRRELDVMYRQSTDGGRTWTPQGEPARGPASPDLSAR